MYPKIFWGALFKALRESNNLSQRELADLLHTSRQEISNLERGRKHPTPELVHAFSNIYDINLMDYIEQCIPKNYKDEQLSFKKKMRSKARKKSGCFLTKNKTTVFFYQWKR